MNPQRSSFVTIRSPLIFALLLAFWSIGHGTSAMPAGLASPAASPAAGATSYTQSGGVATESNQTYAATATDESAVLVTDGGTLTLTDSIIASSGDSSSMDESSFHGLNAAVLATTGSTIDLSASTITTSGKGANGVFATGTGSAVVLTDVEIVATGDGGHAVMATAAGALTLTDVDMSTAGASSGAIATDRGGGTIVVTGGNVTTSGHNSPGIYSTGDISATGAKILATGAESAVIEGANSITLTDTDLSSSMADKWGVMLYQSMSGDAEGTRGTFTMTGGSLANTATTGPLFYVTNSTGVIALTDVEITAASGTLLQASTGQWGNTGSNGGTAILTADQQALIGDLVADASSSITFTLQHGSTLAGAVDAAGTAREVNLTLDPTSTWTVTADSRLSTLTGAVVSGNAITNIVGNGHTVIYDATLAENSWLNGGTYTLVNGGELVPR